MSVVVNGVWDCFHGGHFSFLYWCWKFHAYKNDYPLIVGIDSDKKVKQDKGQNRPYFTEKERTKHVLETGFVDDVFLFDSNEELSQKIKIINPEILIKDKKWLGSVVGAEFAKQLVFFDRIPVSISTTEIENRVMAKHR
ncbi:MAG: adenylyltransferase/cytidyltransferase family protein [Candidatus Parcubacteria bacterium]|nr:adenylyltransferase/cytidyltransferase family protein [Candidatus Parcubacteria bacterium]